MGFLIAGGDHRPKDVRHHSSVTCPLSLALKSRTNCMGIDCPVFEQIKDGLKKTDPNHGIGRCGLSANR